MSVGIQESGGSYFFTKEMALKAISLLNIKTDNLVAIDIGAGEGELTKVLSPLFNQVFMLDVYKPQIINNNVIHISSDLNRDWVVPQKIDFAFSLEVVEHIENPRHFFRQVNSILNSEGYFFLTTPNNHSLFSKLTFILKGEHRYFQDPSYPAHITPLTIKDLKRIADEAGFSIIKWFYSNEDKLPLIHVRIRLPGKLFSMCLGVLLKKNKNLNNAK